MITEAVYTGEKSRAPLFIHNIYKVPANRITIYAVSMFM